MDLAGPETSIRVEGCNILLVGTIPGFVPDADRVHAIIRRHVPQVVAVGIPAEDLEALEAIMEDPEVASDLEPDDLDAHLLGLLERFGDTKAIPSPDLQAVHDSGVPIMPVDMDDGHHTGRYTELVKVHHLVQRGSTRRRLQKRDFLDAADPYTLVQDWDARLLRVKPLRLLEVERERHMADGIRALAARYERLVAVVHVARFAGVSTLLSNGP